MVNITFVEQDGTRHEAKVNVGDDLMHAALDNNIDGVIGECGGASACATCHVYLEPRIIDLLPTPDPNEREMLDFTVAPQGDTSRLGCQVEVNEAMAGMIVTLPSNQV